MIHVGLFKKRKPTREMNSREFIEHAREGLVDLAREHEHPSVIKDIQKTFNRIENRDFRKKVHRDRIIEDIHDLEKHENCRVCRSTLDQVNVDLIKNWGYKDRKPYRNR